MLIELLSQSNYQSYNVKLAHLIGLKSAIYLNALIEINEKAIRKNKLVDGNYFIVDRDYIKNRTTIDNLEQEEIEKSLFDMDFIAFSNDKTAIKVNIDTLTTVSMSQDETLVNDLSKIRNKANKNSANQAILFNVKRNINTTLPDELKDAYCEWLDVVNQKFGFVSKQLILEAQTKVDKASNFDLDIALGIIHTASANGWKNIDAAIDVYTKNRATVKITGNVKENKNVDFSSMKNF